MKDLRIKKYEIQQRLNDFQLFVNDAIDQGNDRQCDNDFEFLQLCFEVWREMTEEDESELDEHRMNMDNIVKKRDALGHKLDELHKSWDGYQAIPRTIEHLMNKTALEIEKLNETLERS